MTMGRGKDREKIRQIKYMYNIFYTGGSGAPLTNHDRSYRSRESDDLRLVGPVKAPATAGGAQVFVHILFRGRGVCELVPGSASERFDQ